MGFFSWHRCDDGKVITNRYSKNGATPVEMLDDKGNVYREDNYEGYGDFDGVDYYALLDEMNGGDGDRDRGIKLAFPHVGEEVPRLKVPKFRAPQSTKTWGELPDPELAENQGFFY